jgi:hypothetical protein
VDPPITPPTITGITCSGSPCHQAARRQDGYFLQVATQIVINGSNFGPNQDATCSVTFGGVDGGRATSWSNTAVSIPVPGGATPGNVLVTVQGVPSNGMVLTPCNGPGNYWDYQDDCSTCAPSGRYVPIH